MEKVLILNNIHHLIPFFYSFSKYPEFHTPTKDTNKCEVLLI